MDIKKLKDRNSEPDADTVAVLEEALEMAKSGRLRSVALAGSLTGHATYTNYATRDLQESIGLVGFLHHTLCAKLIETPAP